MKACQLQAISSESVTDKSVIRTGTSVCPVPSVTNVWSPSIHQFKLWKRLGSYNTHAYTAIAPVPNVAMQNRHNCVILQSCSVLLCVVVRLFEITAMTLWKTFSQPFKGLFEGSSKGLALRCNGWSFIFVRFPHASYSTTTILTNAASKWLFPHSSLIYYYDHRSYRLGWPPSAATFSCIWDLICDFNVHQDIKTACIE